MLLIIINEAKKDTDWISFEIEKVVDYYQIPIIAAYPDISSKINNMKSRGKLWPGGLN